MLLDRARQIALLETIAGTVGNRGDLEVRLVGFLSLCRQADSDARKAVLACHDGKQGTDEEVGLIGRCRVNDPAAWELLITRIEPPLLNEVRTQDLITRCLARDSDAQVELFRSIEAKAKEFLCCRIYNLTEEDLKDLTMVFAAKVFRELPKFDARMASFGTFWRVLLNQIYIDYLRRIKTIRRDGNVISIDAPDVEQQAMGIPAPGPGPDDEAIQFEVSRLVHEALDKLGSSEVRCRKLIGLFHFDGRSYEQIANTLSMNAKTVSTALVRCREKMREYFPKEFREQARRYRE